MKKNIRVLSLVLVIALLLAGCSSGDSGSKDNSKETVKFGITAALTGTNKMIGDQIVNGAKLAQEYINDNGGILGKELELVIEDEIDNQQSSVNAMIKLMEYEDLVGFYGSTSSGYCIAASPNVLEKKIPMIAGGSSANIPKENNPYIWQTRMTDDQTGKVLARVASESLNMKNPAILYSTESFGTGLKDQTVAALTELGINVKEENLYGYLVDEQNYTAIIAQIENSDCDGIIAIAQQSPAINIVNQIDSTSIDIPLLGSASFSCDVVFTNCGDAANDWYSVCEWVPTIDTTLGKQLSEDYKERFNANCDAPTAYTFDSVLLFAEACELANSVTDIEAINEAFAQIKDFEGAMSKYTYSDNHSFASSLLVTQNIDGQPKVIEAISVK